MIDLNILREKPSLVRENLKKRFQPEKIKITDQILETDGKWRKLKSGVDELRAQRNKISIEISELKKKKKSVTAALKKAKEIPGKIAQKEQHLAVLEDERNSLLAQLPNFLISEVPVGKDASENKELRKWGKALKPKFELKNHAELIESLGNGDFEAGRNNAGEGFNYLLGDIAILDRALQNY